MRRERPILVSLIVVVLAAQAFAQQAATSGTFILPKFARTNGKETYSIETSGDTYMLTSHFLFKDRGSAVPLETKFVAHTADLAPVTYVAEGRSSRQSAMNDSLAFRDGAVTITRDGKSKTVTPSAPWFITDGYSPVAMQEQMMRWWLARGRPAAFTVYPADAKVHIVDAGPLTVNGLKTEGYTIDGLIWGQESL